MSAQPRMPDEATPGGPGDPRLITQALLREWTLPAPTGTKYSRGQVTVIGGARRSPGGSMLAGIAALRMGAGRLTLAVAEGVAPHVAVAVPESGVIALPESAAGSVTGDGLRPLLEREMSRADAVLVGPGLDDAEATVHLIEELVPLLPDDLPVILDAYAATALPSLDRDCARRLAGRVAVTPNDHELDFLIGDGNGDESGDESGDDNGAVNGDGNGGDNRDEAAAGDGDLPGRIATVVDRFDAVVACSGWVATRDGFWKVATGDTGLGTSGSGDVLAGAVAGLITRGAPMDQAMVWGVYSHAAAGDRLATEFGRVGYLAGELLAELPLVLAGLRGD